MTGPGIFFNRWIDKKDEGLVEEAKKRDCSVDDFIIRNNPGKPQAYAWYNGREQWPNPDAVLEE